MGETSKQFQGQDVLTYKQWQIQDLLGGHQSGGTNLIFGQMFAENCMKMKEIGLRWGTINCVNHTVTDPGFS